MTVFRVLVLYYERNNIYIKTKISTLKSQLNYVVVVVSDFVVFAVLL